MKSKGYVCLMTALLSTLALTVGTTAQSSQAPVAKHHRYKVVDLGTFGGPSSSVNCCEHQITARGVVVGSADTSAANPNPGCFNGPLGVPDCNVSQAFQWRDGALTNLGALPGGYNSYSQVVNARGTVVGSAENGVTYPVVGIAEFEAVLWRNGQITKIAWGPRPLDLSLDLLLARAVTFQGVFSHTWDTWERVLRLESAGQVRLAGMISHRVPLKDWKKAFDALENGEAIKALIFPNGVEE